MKVWVATHGEYCGSTDAAWLLGVFSTQEKAAAFRETRKREWYGEAIYECEITEVEIDEPLAEPVRLV